MKKQNRKVLLIGICMLAAGICYSCNKNSAQDAGAVQDAWTLAESEAEPGSLAEPETEPESLAEQAKKASETEEVWHYIHICGEVMNPGVYKMEDKSRIFQVVERAGGFTQAAAGEYLNMAQAVWDGMKIIVPSAEEVEEGRVPSQEDMSRQEQEGGSQAAGGQPDKVNLNTASREQLMTLKGIGEARAEDIIRYREEKGSFESIEEIMEISGIKDAAFQKIKDNITV